MIVNAKDLLSAAKAPPSLPYMGVKIMSEEERLQYMVATIATKYSISPIDLKDLLTAGSRLLEMKDV